MAELAVDLSPLVTAGNPSPSNHYASLISSQRYAVLQALQLESGERLANCPIAYKTWGTLSPAGDNVLVICHAITGSADVSDWWTPLLGAGRAFDPRHFYIFCANALGSPYGSASPLTIDPATGEHYGPTFPTTTVRDDVRAQKAVLDALGVKKIAAVIGGSMGGMAVLEWPLCTPQGYVRNIIPIATAADHSAWGIGWAETQRQCLLADPGFDDGWYDPTPQGQPAMGLAAARMIAMLTYRSSASFDARFGRKPQHMRSKNVKPAEPMLDLPRTDGPVAIEVSQRRGIEVKRNKWTESRNSPAFSAQGYLHYQGEKFISRFDANCYLHITNKMDSHDVTRGRIDEDSQLSADEALQEVLSVVPSGTLVISVESDALFLPEQQERLAACLPNASLETLKSSDGHDGFLLEFEQLDRLIQGKLRSVLPDLYRRVYDDIETIKVTEGESLAGEVDSW